MGFRVEYAPSATLLGSVAQQSGFGQYAMKAQAQALEHARFQADLMDRQARFMAGEQQRAIENQMRAQQMAEGAMKDRAQFGLQQALAQDRSQRDWFTDLGGLQMRREQLGYAKERDQAEDLLKRETEISRQAGFDRMNQTKLAMEQERTQRQWDMLEEKGRQAIEMAGVKFNAKENQQLALLDQKEAFLQGKLQEGGALNPQWQAQLRGIQAQRDQMVGAAKQRTLIDEAAAEQQRQKAIEQRHYTRDGVPYIMDQHGTPHVDPGYQEEMKHVAKFTQDYYLKNGSYPRSDTVQGFRDSLRGKAAPEAQNVGGFGQGMVGNFQQAMSQVQEIARSATSVDDFRAKIRQQYPNATDEQIAQMLRRLKGG